MPLSAAVHDSPHCGRGQRGIDFFFKSSPSLTSSVTEDKRDILTYFKRVEIAKDQEDQSYTSSFTNNSDVTESSSSEGDESKPRKSGVVRKKNSCDLPSNCETNLNKNEKVKPSKRQKSMTLDCDNETAKVSDANEKLASKAGDKGKPLNGTDKDFPTVGCKKENINDKDNSPDHKSPELKSEGCLEVESNIKDKEETKNSTRSDSTEVKKNAFTFLMANRVKQTETSKSSQEEEDDIIVTYDNSCVILDDSTGDKCEKEGNKNASLSSTAAKKKNISTKKITEKEDKSKDLDSSLQDFDLTPYEKLKKKRGRKAKNKEEITTTASSAEVAATGDFNQQNSCNDEKPSTYISFTDYIKSACVAKESAMERNIAKETDGIKKEVTNESLQQQATNSNNTLEEADETKKNEETLSNPKMKETQEETTNSNRTLREPDDIQKREITTVSETNDKVLQNQTANTCCTPTEADENEEEEVVSSESKTGECQELPTTNRLCSIKEAGEGAVSKVKKNELQQQKTTDSNVNSTEGCNSALKEKIDASVECDEPAKIKLVDSSKVKEETDDQNKVKEPPKAKQAAAPVQRRRTKKKIVSSDSDEDFKPSRAAGVSRERNSKVKEDSKSCEKSSASPSISNFFRKISQKEKDEEKNKTVITVQADVHAPLDGNETTEKRLSSPLHSQGCGELGKSSDAGKADGSNIQGVKKSALKVQKGIHTNKCSLDELNKIELLEQILPSKPGTKRVLRKVEKVDEDRNAEDNDTENVKSKVTVVPKKGELPKKKTLSVRKRTVKNSVGARKRSLRRKKSESSTSGEESTEELFIRKKTKPPLNDRDAMEAKSNTSSSSSISVDGDVENPEKSSSVPQSSEGSEDDKENVAHYTSQLLRQPGKLSLRLKRVHPPQESCRKRKKLKLRKASKSPNHQRVKKILKKAKDSKSTHRKRRLCASQKPSPREKTEKDQLDAAQAQAASVLITINDEDKEDSTRKQAAKKTAAKRKVTQTRLKPLLPKAAKGMKKRLIQKSLKISEGEEKNDLQRRPPRRAAAAAASKNYIEVEVDENDEPKKANKNKKVVQNKAVKLAPIFCKRPASPSGIELLKVVPLSPSKLKARQEFLNSSVSDDVRKQVSAEKGSLEEESVPWPPFPEVSHTQQREEGVAPWNLEEPELPLQMEATFSPAKNLRFTPDYPVLKRDSEPGNVSYHVPHLELGDIILSLSCMKTKYPDFPVYEVFKAYYEMKKAAVESYQKEVKKEEVVIDLHDEEENPSRRRKRKGKNKLSTLGRGKRRKLANGKEVIEDNQQNQEEFKSLWHEKTPHMWTQIFMPKNASQVIGNAENVTKLKLWLQEWKNNPQIKLPKRKKKSAKKDDFVVSDESTYGDDVEEFVSTYLLCGPPGVGKTAAVYALASELGYKVLEVNASSRRPGRQVMSQLAEATQSHSVSNTSSSASQSSNAFTALFSARNTNSVAKKDISQKEYSSSNTTSNKTKGVSLVLFEDVDIVFDEWDEGFMSTVNSLMATTKRPIILTATHACPILFSRIKESFEVMEFGKPPQKLIAQHLQLVALANGCHICPYDAECLVHLNKGDIRKSMLDLQLMSQSGSSHENCDCSVAESTDDSTMESCREVFPEAKDFNQKPLKKTMFYKLGLWRRLNVKPNYNALSRISEPHHLCDNEDISWEEIGSNLNYVLPFPVSEREKSLPRYPLQSDDPLLKKSNLGMYESLLCLDDPLERESEPVTQVPEEDKPRNPPEVLKASQSCLKSLSSFYDSMAQLDILSSQITTEAAKMKDIGWWVKQPTAGLSDNPGVSHPKWRSCSNEDIIQELAQRALNLCGGEIASALEEVSAKDWPQLSLPWDKSKGMQSCIMQSAYSEWERTQKRSVINRISSQLPALNQLSHSAGLDYLPALRSFAREDELGAALGRRKRGRRYLSYFLQLGWTLSPDDRISLANALIA